MADINDFSGINENFDTIKTLLNTIRAQGVLNTSDIDKLLTGINSKLEKINTEEDIDLIKAFLSELKQNLDERHNVLVSKFGAIESLFSNLLKNSSEAVKTDQLKEVFDIVATNLSVFSREVVSQKETLSDITLRIDAMRSDDSQKKDIIKSIGSVKHDIEKLSNGFDSIVLSLNENFKTVLKTISEIDQSETISEYGKQLTDLIESSNTILSAIQMMDKKNNNFEGAFEKLATQEDVASIQKSILELSLKSRDINNLVDSLVEKSYKIDNLAEKIDASVSIIAGLKAEVADAGDDTKEAILERLNKLEEVVKEVSTASEFEQTKIMLNAILDDIAAGNKNLASVVNNIKEDIKEKVVSETDKLSQLLDANILRTINDISANAESLNSTIKDSRVALSELCEKSFSEISSNITGLKTVISTLDENNISANNAIFSNITDRLAIFENSLKTSLEKQEDFVANSSSSVFEQVSNIKDISEKIDYRLDSSAIEITNTKREYEELKNSVNNLLALDFAGTLKDVKTDLYAVNQELKQAIEATEENISEAMTKDLFGKYELIVSKVDNVEDEIKAAQTSALKNMKETLDSISSQIVDVLSYVSVAKDVREESLDVKFAEVTKAVNDSNLNYVENVRDIVDVIRAQVEINLKQIATSSEKSLNNLSANITATHKAIQSDIKNSYEKLAEVQSNFDELRGLLDTNNTTLSSSVENMLEATGTIKKEFDAKLTYLQNALLEKVTELKNEYTVESAEKVSELKFNSENLSTKTIKRAEELKEELEVKVNDVIGGLTSLESSVQKLSGDTTSSLTNTVEKVLESFVTVKSLINAVDEQTEESLRQSVADIKRDFAALRKRFDEADSAIDEDLARQISIIEGSFESLNLLFVDIMNQGTEAIADRIKKELGGAAEVLSEELASRLEHYKGQLELLFDELKERNNAQADYIEEKVLNMNRVLETNLDKQNSESALRLDEIAAQLKDILDKNFEISTADYEALKAKLIDFTEDVAQSNDNMVSAVRAQFDDIVKYFDSSLEVRAEEINGDFEKVMSSMSKIDGILSSINPEFNSVKEILFEQERKIDTIYALEIKPELDALEEKLHNMFENNNLNFIAELNNQNSGMAATIKNSADMLEKEFSSLNERLDKDELSRINIYQSQMGELSANFNKLIAETQDILRNEVGNLLSLSTDVSSNEMQSMETYTNDILDTIEKVKRNSIVCKDMITALITEQVNILSGNIEKETDVIVADIIEQFGLIRDTQKDDLLSLSASIEGSVSGYVIDAVNDLKSYIDIKTNDSILNAKLDNLKNSLEDSIRETLSNINKLLDRSVFSDAISDIKAANEVLISSMADKLNNEVTSFILQNVSKKFDDKFNLFDKKFTDTIVDKYEEIKLLSTGYNKSFEKIAISVQDLISQFVDSKDEINSRLKDALSSINGNIDDLKKSFNDLKSQIMNKSLDEAFHDAVHNQIAGIEDLVREQLGYIQDISDLCCDNLPEMTEMNTLVKYSIIESIKELNEKMSTQSTEVAGELNSLKADIITQILNVFNQISFIAEQEEIIDFIQEKHSELITILSHIVTNSANVETVKDNLAVVDNKIDSLKEDIDLINEKITAIMSSDGDIDYVYSLQDLESDIAALRIVLNEMKADNKSKEFEELIGSTNNIYKLVETIKEEMPKFETEEFKKDFESLAEDIVSISTRTNKLILTSDESYKTLQDNLQDFKLVINDLDERTRNFPKEAGIDKIDTKLASINTMIQNGAKTNQVFNQVFEYLAEWVDKAGAQITAISDKVETLDEIGQIRVMLEDMRAEAEDNTESVELIDALTNVFDKQAKRIASMEAKIDRLIVENTINKKETKFNIKPIEDTLNRFLAAIDDTMSLQQNKINSLEEKLEEVVSLVDNKDTAQLTKKVGGMDRQLAKLNKSIEKIASNVVEK